MFFIASQYHRLQIHLEKERPSFPKFPPSEFRVEEQNFLQNVRPVLMAISQSECLEE